MSDLRSGAQLKAARALAGLTQKQLAETAGLHTNSIRYLERQDHITPAYSTERVINALHHHGVEVFLQPSWGVRLVAER